MRQRKAHRKDGSFAVAVNGAENRRDEENKGHTVRLLCVNSELLANASVSNGLTLYEKRRDGIMTQQFIEAATEWAGGSKNCQTYNNKREKSSSFHYNFFTAGELKWPAKLCSDGEQRKKTNEMMESQGHFDPVASEG
jgi:hypothetical protein